MHKKKKILSTLLAGVLSVTALNGLSVIPYANAVKVNNTQSNVVEYLNRGISAVNTGDGMLVNWRFLASDPDNSVFKLYRDNNLIYTSTDKDNSVTKGATCFLDKSGNAKSVYKVECYNGSELLTSDTCSIQADAPYFDIKLSPPSSNHTPNDMSVGDVDGDGEYELFLKWDPTDSKDNSQKGKTGKVYIDCYKLNGTRLWRIDLGVNIRAGAHYTQFFVADYDLDGKAEMCCKTSDGTIDGTGAVIGDASKDYRNGDGLVITGNEYYTLFDGATGKALDTIDYEPPRGDTTKWGKSSDKFNRVDRFWGTTAYLDGVHPCVVTGRGYYGRMTATAYKVENKKLVKMWFFDTGTSSSAAGYGDGNHNTMPADVDGDGKQEIITGSTCIDDNGKILWNTNQGHGDAMHVGDLDPENEGLEAWICHEDKPYGVSLIDCDTGKIIFHNDAAGDTGRCCADNVWAGNPGAELWGNKESDDSTPVKNVKGETLSCNRPAINFLTYWDGDLEREILDGGNRENTAPAKISKMNENGKITQLMQTDGYYTCNTTKGTPCLSADIFGDWREELIVRAADSKSIRIFTTTYDTDYRVQCLMHDPQYRSQVSAQNTAYNQPPHVSYFMGTGYDMPERSKCTVNTANSGTVVTPPTPTPTKTAVTMDTSVKYMFKNVGSGLYMEVAGATAEAGANVQQWGADGEAVQNTWKLQDAGDGYYYIRSYVGDSKSYYLDLTAGKAADGTNIEIWSKNEKDAQKFKFFDNGDGTYTIATKTTKDASCISVENDSKDSGANIVQNKDNGSDFQKWTIDVITIKDGATLDTSKNYMIQNVNSGQFLEVQDGKAEAGANVQQWGADTSKPDAHNVWHFEEVNWGYYYVYSGVGEGNNLLLQCDNNKDGANIYINDFQKSSNQYFKFVDNEDGTYTIVTRSSKDLSCVEVASADTKSGANVQQWAWNDNNCQKWKLIPVDYTLPYQKKPETITGDINKDGKLSADDAILLQKWILGQNVTLPDWQAGDLTGDGRLDIFDLVILRKNLVK
ncbi:MAG: RICIN domain-containing protein [Prevotella sp.]|nr:RICIN domain-containing protein [Alistipes senegalensis]MCM1358649.1 RICIN domain-containing protein [Prevotella sp.]MCM1474360.1 RICIN domain-containing protein [Muribaculaceae bacterium]